MTEERKERKNLKMRMTFENVTQIQLSDMMTLPPENEIGTKEMQPTVQNIHLCYRRKYWAGEDIHCHCHS